MHPGRLFAIPCRIFLGWNKILSNLSNVVLPLTQPATFCIIRNCFSKIISLFSDLAKTRTVSQIHHDYCLVVSERMGIAFPSYSPILGCKRAQVGGWQPKFMGQRAAVSSSLRVSPQQLWSFFWRRGKSH